MGQVPSCRAVPVQGGDRDNRRGRRRRGVAIVVSPLMPIGPARAAEPSPGIEVNLAILGAGFAVIAATPLLAGGARGGAGGYPGPGRARAGRAGRADATLPAGPGARAGRLGAGQPGGADGVRARARAHRGTGAQRPGRDDGGGGGGRGGHGLRCQLPRAGRHAAPVRAELGPRTGPSGRLRAADPWQQSPGGDHRPDRLRGWQLRAGQPRCPRQRQRHGGARDRPRPAAREWVPDPARGPGPGQARRDRPRPAHPARAGAAPRAAGRGRRGRHDVPDAGGGLGGLRGLQRGRRQRHRPGDRRRGPGLGAVPAESPVLRPAADLLQLFPPASTGRAPICRPRLPR